MAIRQQTTQPIGQRISMTAQPTNRPAQGMPTTRPPINQPPVAPPVATTQTQSSTNLTFGAPGAPARPQFAVGSTNASAQPFQYDQFREFGDSVMQEYERNIEPEIEQRRARVNQDLVNKGLTPGSEAYEREMDRFMRMENDLFQTAQRGALEQGLAAQNQAFGQSLGQANINAGLKQAQIGAETSMYGVDQNRAGSLERLIAGLNQQESEFARGLGQRQTEFGQNLGQRQYEFDNTQDQNRYFFDENLGQRGSEFDRTFGLQSGQADFANLMSILGYGMDRTGFNNQANANDLSNVAGILGGFTPNSPFVPINAGGAYNTQLNAQQARAGIRQGNADRLASGIGAVGSAFMMSDRNIKEDFEAVDSDESLETLRRIPVSRWKYKGDINVHIGPMAQDFGAEVNDDPEATQISVVDAVGLLMSSVQALSDKVEALEARHAV